jgi:hypothetical protein
VVFGRQVPTRPVPTLEDSMGIFVWLEQTWIATFIRESPSLWGFPAFLLMHSLGLSLVVGPCVIAAGRVLGMARSIPLQPLVRLFPYMWFGFILTVISGVGLAIADAQNKLTNPILLAKLVLVLLAAVNMWLLEKKVFRAPGGFDESTGHGRLLGGSVLFLWLLVTVLGRLIAYSRTIFEGV